VICSEMVIQGRNWIGGGNSPIPIKGVCSFSVSERLVMAVEGVMLGIDRGVVVGMMCVRVKVCFIEAPRRGLQMSS
jgi:hypothetical protein